MGTRSGPRKLRKAFAALAALLYLVSVGSFWVAGFLAYLRHFDGPARWLGLLLLPTLALPLVGRGTLAGFAVKSFPLWWGWFGLHVLLVVLAVLLYGSDNDGDKDALRGGGGSGEQGRDHRHGQGAARAPNRTGS